MPGAKAVFEKFTDYVPRAEKADWLSGGKNMLVDRIEWVIIPDAATASAALQNGEVDWWETPISDLVPLLKKNRNIKVDIADPLGNVGSFRMNHLFPPFNEVKIRRAVQMALSQEDYMQAVVGSDEKLWKPQLGFFTNGTPLYTEAGGEILKKHDLDGAKKLLVEGGYKGEPVTCIIAQDQAVTKAMGEITGAIIAITLVLLVCAAVLGQTILRLSALDAGVDARNVLVTRMALSPSVLSDPDAARAAWDDVLRRAMGVPGVTGIAMVDTVPMREGNNQLPYSTRADVRADVPASDQQPVALATSVTPGYLDVMGIPLRRGRFFDTGDRAATAPVVEGHAGGMFYFELRHFVDCVRKKATPAVTPADGLAALRIALAVERAAATGAAVAP